MENILKKLLPQKTETKSKKKIENIVFFIVILIITLILMKTIWSNGTSDEKDNNIINQTNEVLAVKDDSLGKEDLEQKLEKILSTIKGVGKVNVFINYSESSSNIPLYDESTTTSTIEEDDANGGKRNTTETENQKEVVFTEKSGNKNPVMQKTTMPIIQGAIVTAQGVENANVKLNITNAVQAVTGISIDKIQVFEMGG